jgi:hypothetical protein
VVRDGKIVEYHVDVKLAFIVEPALATANGIDVLAQDYATG